VKLEAAELAIGEVALQRFAHRAKASCSHGISCSWNS
jgi:hypothetical protein